jgi:hypothetical protein
MFIRVSDPAVLPALLDALNQHVRYVAKKRSADTIHVGVLGSLADAGELDLEGFLGAWRTAHIEIEFELAPVVHSFVAGNPAYANVIPFPVTT